MNLLSALKYINRFLEFHLDKALIKIIIDTEF